MSEIQNENLFLFYFRTKVPYLKVRLNERRTKCFLAFPSGSLCFLRISIASNWAPVKHGGSLTTTWMQLNRNVVLRRQWGGCERTRAWLLYNQCMETEQPVRGYETTSAWFCENQSLVTWKPKLGYMKTNAWLHENQCVVARV